MIRFPARGRRCGATPGGIGSSIQKGGRGFGGGAAPARATSSPALGEVAVREEEPRDERPLVEEEEAPLPNEGLPA